MLAQLLPSRVHTVLGEAITIAGEVSMPENPQERAQRDAELKAAEKAIGAGRKRKRAANPEERSNDVREENQRLTAENARLNEQLRGVRARLDDAQRALENQNDRHRSVEPSNAELVARIATQATEIANQSTEIAALRRSIEVSTAHNRSAASGSGQQPADRLATQQQNPHDDRTPGREQFRDILPNGSRPDRTRSFRHPIEVVRPDNIGRFVRNGGLPNEGGNRYIIPPGVITEPHRDLLPNGQDASRASTPVAQRPQPVYYNDKVYYHIAASNIKDAEKLGLRFEKKTGSTWENVEAFQRDLGLWCCDAPNIDRSKLSHFTQRNPVNGDFLEAGVHPSGPDQIVMAHRDRSSRGR